MRACSFSTSVLIIGLSVSTGTLFAQATSGGGVTGSAPSSSGTATTKFEFPPGQSAVFGEQGGFMVTPLPEYQSVQGLGEDGVLLLRHIYTGELSHWRNGAIEQIDTTSIFAINNKGDFIRQTAGAGYVLEKTDGTRKIIQLDTGPYSLQSVQEFSDNFAVGYLTISLDPIQRIPVRWDFSGGYRELASAASHPLYPYLNLFQPTQVNDRGDYMAWKYSADGDYPLIEGTFLNDQLIEGLEGCDLNNQGSALLLKRAEASNPAEIPFFWNGTLHRIGDMAGVAVALNDQDQIIAWEYDYDTDPYFPSFVRSSLWSRTTNAAGNIAFGSIDLNQITGLGNAYATGINNAGEVVLNEEVNQTRFRLLVPKSDRLGVDFDRDGVIDPSRLDTNPDRELARKKLPWYFWVNDDNDADETDGNDIPGGGSNGTDGQVNGTRDLVDFFPVHLDIDGLLATYPVTDPTIAYKLAQADGAANFLTTDLTPATAGSYHSDSVKAKTLGDKQVTQITAGGVTLDSAFLGKILTADGGIILVEARAATDKPLRLEVWRGTTLLSKVELPLKFGGVETMFRHVNLTGAVGITPETFTRDGAPNWPDELNNNQAFVFVHGYNVNQKQARGSQAEFFKRLWWSGSRAQFWGVTWYGFESQVPVAGFAPDLQSNVVSAFGTAPQFKEFITELRQVAQFTDISVAAHSLGNTVVSSAISDHGAQISRYFLIDAAVPSEAYDAGEAESNAASAIMPHTEWNRERGVYHPSLWATNWGGLFPATDVRSQLTWRDRFRPKSSPDFITDYYDFHSSGEEVLALDDGLTPSMTGIIFSQLWNYIENVLPGREGQPAGTKSWVYQEKLKGRLIAGKIASSKFGGWGFNYFHFKKSPGGAGGKGPMMTPAVLTPVEASGMLTTVFTPEALREEPFFRPGGNRVKVASWLLQPDGSRKFTTDRLGALYGPTGSDFASRHRDTLLARMIPSMSLATGRVAVEALGNPPTNFNFDMNDPVFRGDTAVPPWPAPPTRRDKNWWHSDFRRVAYPYVHRLYDRIVSLGNLNEKSP